MPKIGRLRALRPDPIPKAKTIQVSIVAKIAFRATKVIAAKKVNKRIRFLSQARYPACSILFSPSKKKPVSKKVLSTRVIWRLAKEITRD